ncbi:hypothetical protein ACSU64_04385 [Bacillaceae bacterium C204]|uniref:hypothetical protein n=1 Tax=Neobacillus sp. 204 TaxID=3383351 RepID=UPI0039789103
MLTVKKNNELSVKFNKVEFDESNSQYKLSGGSSDNQTQIKFEYVLPIHRSGNSSAYELYIFHKKNAAENDIYQIYEKSIEKRIGWVFPIQALNSIEHSYADNQFFLNYAFVAYEKLLKGEFIGEADIKEPLLDQSISYSLYNFYEDDIILFVISKAAIEELGGFNFADYIPWLYKCGYYYLPKIEERYEKYDARFNVKKVSNEIKDEKYIHYLFKEILTKEQHHIVKFHLLYQVIELLIEKIFHKEFKEMIQGVSSGEMSFFKLKDEIGTIAKEKQRIQKLFDNYINGSFQSKNILGDKCNDLLRVLNREESSASYEALYSVRNILVHENRKVMSKECVDIICSINDNFEDVIIDILVGINNIN